MHNKSIVAAITLFLSVGAPFLWNLIFAAAYPLATAYRVRGGFFTGFGQNPTWWLTLIFIIISVYMYELCISALRKAFFPTDTDVFQELEQDKAFMARYNGFTALDTEWISNRYSDDVTVCEAGDVF
jgi:phospholipid-translocating ATPase